MAYKLASLTSGNVHIEDHLDIHVSNDKETLILRVTSQNGVSAGKALLQYLDKPGTDVSLVKHVVLDVASRVNLQFLFFFLAAPIAIIPGKWIGAGIPSDQKNNRTIQVNLYSIDAVLQIPSLILNVADNQVGIRQTLDPLFRRDVTFNVVGTPERIENAKKALLSTIHVGLKWMQDLTHGTIGIPPDLNALKEKVFVFLEKHLRYIESEAPAPIVALLTRSSLTSNQFMWLETKFLAGKLIHVKSDETAHLFSSGKDAIMVDAGNKVICDFLCRALTTNTLELTALHIAITHFHDEHVDYLLPLVRAAKRANVNVFLYSPFNKKTGAIGFLPAFDSLHITFLNLDALSHQTATINTGDVTSSITAVEPPPAIKHYLSSHGFVIISKEFPSFLHPVRVRVFTGDINHQNSTQGVSEIIKGLRDYLNTLVEKAEHIGDEKTYEIFIDIGHLMFHPEFGNIKRFLDEWEDTFLRSHIGKIYHGHIKNNTGTIVKAGDERLPVI